MTGRGLLGARELLDPDYELDCSGDYGGDYSAAFDDSDGAYAVVEPDPFAEPPPAPLRRPSLRAELGALPAVPVEDLARRAVPPLPVRPEFSDLLPGGLRRGSTLAVTGSVALLLALLGTPSRKGAWTALVGLPTISAEAAHEAGIDLARLAIVTPPDGGWTGPAWTTAVGALLDAVDVVVARPGAIRGASGITDADARRLSGRARTKDAVLVVFGQAAGWPGVQVTLTAEHGGWAGISDGHGRLTRRRLVVSASGRGRSARPRSRELWL